MAFLRRHLETIVVSAIVAAIVAGGPAVAHGVKHALFAHRAGTAKVAKNAKAFGGKSPKVFESHMSTATLDVDSEIDEPTRAVGEEAVQTITVQNEGPGNATGVNLSISKQGWTPSIPATPRCSDANAAVSCTNLFVPKGATFTLVITWTAGCTGLPGGFESPMFGQVTGWKYDATPQDNGISETTTTTGCPP